MMALLIDINVCLEHEHPLVYILMQLQLQPESQMFSRFLSTSSKFLKNIEREAQRFLDILFAKSMIQDGNGW